MFNFRKLFEKKHLNADSCLAQESHWNIMKLAKCYIDNQPPEEADFLLQYLIDTVLDDICTSKIIEPLISYTDMPLIPPIISYCYDENGKEVTTLTKRIVEVNLTTAKLYLCPWNNEKLSENLCSLRKKDFEFQGNANQISFYYEEINLCHVCDGNHSINAGRYLKKGTIKSELRSLKAIFPHCFTDGNWWYNKYTNKRICDVTDFRFAAAYSLAQLRSELLIPNKSAADRSNV